ncbi:ABC transporter ATP-binding protein [Komagataeibacter xylinus]|uniref:ABC transporter ATP-binding protein n=1 Tax=Komagataeibacter xylinus TaxID=28448 RepID=A0A318PGI8_KOMXY|nr:ABC transporter ATP-binding protein [Komagataeibacter xylinus]AZV37801.1 ABC transporter ATP-binding protein [Komagataeibacter xylinus]PYD56104.1 ABC transporter ATP-binding protein [Komagataeibacter xylinus]GBQ69205.1 iron ABC transporter ATP-binding protein [Komagataeibacter xylinus NBRC 15237]
MDGLYCEHMTVRYGRRTVLDDISVGPFPPGRVSALLGPNGSGKSTLLRALAGLGEATGRVMLGVDDLTGLTLARRTRRCLYLPQALPAMVHLQVLESMLAAQHATGVVPPDVQGDEIDAALHMLDVFGIADLSMRYMDELSGGQRQLVGLAQALGRHPDALLLDEPLSALDLHHQFAVMEILRRETAARQIVTVMVLHDLNIAVRMTDYDVILREGRIIAAGAPGAVITPVTLARTYDIVARVEKCSRGLPHVMVDGLR